MTPPPVSEAEAHVRRIAERLQARMEDPDIRKVYEASLTVISDLYERESRFLMELIQNADDNVYSTDSPTLNLTFQDGCVQIDSNEAGFTSANVEAICSIGQSTKRRTEGTGDNHFIGGKGIGFKSVFRAADDVWVSSGDYSFKFEKRDVLGMIIPIPAEFPAEKPDHWTSFYLKLSPSYSQEKLIQEFQLIGPETLLFLRKLREIRLKVNQDAPTTLKLKNVQRDEERVSVMRNSSEITYIIKRDRVESEPKVQQYRQSETMLVFPILAGDDREKAALDTQMVYAYLPIRDYGFAFLLHADFKLTPSREGINPCKWNSDIFSSLALAFKRAIVSVDDGPLEYTWIHYVPTASRKDAFKPFRTELINILKNTRVLKSWKGTKCRPTSLMLVPDEYLDDRGEPFTLSSTYESRYLSGKYSSPNKDQLAALGIQAMAEKEFLEHLETLAADGSFFGRKSSTWHSHLSQLLFRLAAEKDYRERIFELRVVPLRSGEWVSVRNQDVYFSFQCAIPDGIKIAIVEPTAESDPQRRAFFEALGVKSVNRLRICELIIQVHADDSFKSTESSTEMLVSHANFLFGNPGESFSPPKNAQLWFVAEYGCHLRGSMLYVDEDATTDSSATRVFADAREEYPFLHSDYSKDYSEQRRKDWVSYIQDHFLVSTLPRLVYSLSGSPFKLSKDFLFIHRSNPSKLFWLLRENWSHYSKWIEEKDTKHGGSKLSDDADELRKTLAELQVNCVNGETYKLNETFFPIDDPIINRYKGISGLPILNIDSADPSGWWMLETFGVAMGSAKEYVLLYLKCLECLEQSGVEYSRNDVENIYKNIQTSYGRCPQLIRAEFSDRKLIHVRHLKTGLMHWVKARECVYQGSTRQAEYWTPDKEYPSCEALFQHLLFGRNDEFDDLLSAAELITPSLSLRRILRQLMKINKGLRNSISESYSEFIHDLRKKRIFPVWNCQSESSIECLSASDTSWFIADRKSMFEAFYCRVNLLAYYDSDLEGVSHLLQAMDLDARRLSIVSHSENHPRGKPYYHFPRSNLIRSKAKFLQCLIPESEQNRSLICSKLSQVFVFEVPVVVRLSSLSFSGHKAFSRPKRVQFAVSFENSGYRIFLTEEGLLSPSVPRELIEQFAVICGITNSSDLALLQQIFGRTTLQEAENAFSTEGFPIELLESTNLESIDVKWIYLKSQPLPLTDEYVHTDRIGLVASNYVWYDLATGEGEIADRVPTIIPLGSSLRQSLPQLPTMEAAEIIGILGEQAMSRFLQRRLRSEYHPTTHWTSKKRHHIGYKPFNETTPHSPYTLYGTCASELTNTLISCGYEELEGLEDRSLVYHIEVATTAGNERSPFPWSLAQLRRSEALSLVSGQTSSPKHVMILARVFDIFSDSGLRLYVDPWGLYNSGYLSVRGDHSLSVVASRDGRRSPSPMPSPFRTSARDFVTPIKRFLKPIEVVNPLLHHSFNIWKKSGRYAYQSLSGKDSFRILVLLPGKPQTELRGVVLHSSIYSAGEYNALSYVWGKSKRRHSLHTPGGIIRITDSLYLALQQLRHREYFRTLWVDAICINQEDDREKSKLVQSIPLIFRSAVSVVAYLGEENDRSHLALETLLQIKIKTLDPEAWPDSVVPEPKTWGERCIPPAEESNVWEAIRALFLRPWFERVWIMQEFIAARKVQFRCGNRYLDWEDVFTAIKAADQELRASTEDKYLAIQPGWDRLMTLANYRSWEERGARWSLLHLLEKFGYTKATLQRDRLFALLGFSYDGYEEAFRPDYSRKTLFEDIVLRFARKFIEKGKVMDLLPRAGLISDRFPSWIPDWTSFKSSTLVDCSGLGVPCSASAGSTPSARVRPRHQKDDELQIDGVFMGKISKVSKFTNELNFLGPYLREVDDMVDSVREYRTSESLSDLKWKAPIADAALPEEVMSTPLDLRASYQTLREILKEAPSYEYMERQSVAGQTGETSQGDIVERKIKERLPLPCLNYVNALQGVLRGWRFVTTVNGWVGVASNDPQPGDDVVIFSGAYVPFCLRPSTKRPGAYRLIGEAYIHGMMDGTVWDPDGLKEIRLH